MARKYYLYAGYYEFYISEKLLRRPLSLLSTHHSFEKAWEAAERNDPDASISVDQSLREECAHHFNMAINNIPVFDGQSRSIENGLTEYTHENARLCPDHQPTTQCLMDYIHYLHVKGGLTLRRARSLSDGKTYRQLDMIVNKYVHA